jgi:hypothetical protein
VAPHGVAVTPLFYGHDPTCKDYKDANKIKTLDVHPVHPWVLTADEVRAAYLQTANAMLLLTKLFIQRGT